MNLIDADALGMLPKAQYLGSTHLVARGLNVLFGPSGAYKSFYMLDQALQIAQLAPVVYVAAEGASGLHRRVTAWCSYYNQTGGDLWFLCQEVNLLREDEVEKLIKAIIEKLKTQIAMVVFDTYARCMIGGDENSAKDTGRVIHHCAQIQRALKCAIGLVHHTNRAEKGERGSGAMRGAADTMIEMSDSDGLIKVSCSKAKDGPEWQPELYRFRSVEETESGVLVPTEFVEASDNLTLTDLEILQFLSMEIFTTSGASARQIQEGLNISIRTLYRILSKLKRLCHIQQDSKGDPYRLLAQGKAALCQLSTAKSVNGKVIPIKRIH